MSFLATENNDRRNLILKSLLGAILLFTSIFLAVSQNWFGIAKDTAVSSEKTTQIEQRIKTVENDYARKDVIETRLKAIEGKLDEMRQEQVEMRKDQGRTQHLLEQVLLERARR